MIFNKQAALKRCAEKHSKTGRIYKMFKRVLNSTYPKGTNLVLVVMHELVVMGLPYVATNMDIDKGADCAEVWRVVYYWFFNKDIGSWTEGQWRDNDVLLKFTDKNKLRVLDLIYFCFKEGRTVSHVGGYVGNHQMIHTTQIAGNCDLRYNDIDCYKSYVGCVRFISDEELASVTVGGEIVEIDESEEVDMRKKGDKGQAVGYLQAQLKYLGFNIGTYEDKVTGKPTGIDWSFGNVTKEAVKKAQSRLGLPITGEADSLTLTAIGNAVMLKNDNSEEIKKLKRTITTLSEKIDNAIAVLA